MTKRILVGCAAVFLSCASLTFGAGRSDIANAVEKGDQAAIKTLLQQKADVNATQVDGSAALHWAVYRNEVDTTDLLLKAGAKVDMPNREGITPLYMAALYGNPAMVDKLLKAGADAKAKGPNGETMVMLAARNGNPQVIKMFVAAGAEVNAKEPARGTTALMWAIEQHHPEAVKALVESGADVAAKTAGAGLPRPYVTGPVGLAGVNEATRRLNAIVNGQAKSFEEQAGQAQRGGGGGGQQPAAAGQQQGANAAAGAAAQRFGNAAAGAAGQAAAGAGAQGQRGAAAGQRGAAAGAGAATGAAGAAQQAAIAAAQAAVDQQDDQDAPQAGLVGGGGGGLTPLVYAAREGDIESARILIASGANVNQVTEYGWTPLLTATNNRHYKLGEFLIDKGADTNVANKGGMTPLYFATDNRNIEGGDYPVPKPDLDHLEFIKYLLDHKANPNAQVHSNTETRTIFTNQWFFEPGATAFMRASQSGDTALMKMLLAYGADPKIRNDFQDTALTVATGIGWVEGITYEWSPQESFEAVKMLVDLGIDINGSNKDGRTPLMGAAHKGRNEVIQYLVDHGADLMIRDHGSRDTDKQGAVIAGHTWIALDYADGLVRVGVQSANPHKETADLIRKMMTDRGLKVPPPNRDFNSLCVVDVCKERLLPNGSQTKD